MDDLKHRLQVAQWIAEEFSGIIGDDHRARLEAWRKESAGNEQEYQELLQEFRSGNLSDPYPADEVVRQWKKFTKKNRSLRPAFSYWYRYAALIILLLGVPGILKWQSDKARRTDEMSAQTISLAQGSPLLVLADGRTMLLNDSVGLARKTGLQQIRFDNRGIAYQKTDTLEKEEIFNTLIIPKGGEFQIQLADGSRVWLNSETELRYPVNFTAEERRVFLKGEAYFEVAKNLQKPFVVTTSAGIDVKVLGTKFNVASYDNDDQVTTTLAEGSVEVGDEKGYVRLKPEEQALFCKGDRSLRVQKVDVGMYLAWKDGKFIFEEQSLEQIMKQLQRWYEMSVFYTNEEVKQYTFSGDLKKYDDFDKIVRMLEEVAGIKVSIKENCVVIGTK